jgi:large subunit ribosomal protein L9
MKVVFLEEVPGSALVGDVKEVKKGYARNFLLPRGLAIPATKDNIRRGDRLSKSDTIRQDKLDSAAQGIAGKIDGARISLTARVGEQGRLYGSITAAKIADELSRIAGEEVDHRQVLLGQSIRTVGTQEIRVRLTRNVFATATVEIAPEQGEVDQPTIAEAVAAVEAEGAAGSGDATVENTSEPPAEGPGSNE